MTSTSVSSLNMTPSDRYLANDEVDVTGLEEGDLVAELLHHGVLALALAVAGRL